MNITNLFKIAWRALTANKLRSFLTMLGIIIGVAAVITMLAIGQGSKQSIQEQISSMGSNILMIRPGQDRGGFGGGGVRQDPAELQTLKLSDYEKIKDEAKYIKAISPDLNSGGQFIYGNNNTPSSLYGVSPDYLVIRQLKMQDGDIFSEQDVHTSAKVCVVGKTVVDKLFTNGEDPIGKVIRFNAIPFRIVGVLKPKGYNAFGFDQDNLVLAPYTTVMKRVKAVTYLEGINCSALTEDLTKEAIADIADILRTSHRLMPAQPDNFTIRSQQEISEMLNTTSDLMTTLLLVVACISLVIGGIGIMNIMYVSVTERTKEIGLRMSVGARGIDILNQFLIEAVLLSVTGGVIGIGLGLAAVSTVSSLAGWPVGIQAWSVFISFLVCTATGIFFGWYPAKKAANLDPIEALRYE